jgi:L-lactate dehydrogenase complex protein LldG
MDQRAAIASIHSAFQGLVAGAPGAKGGPGMSNPVIENVRRNLGRTAHSPFSVRPAILESRQPGSRDAEVETFLNEVRKLSGIAQEQAPGGIASGLAALVAEQAVRKATVWETAHLKGLDIKGKLEALGVELVPANADKHELAQCDLGITEADYLLPETGTLVLRSSAGKPRAASLLPRIHLAIVRPEMLRADLHQVFAEAKDSNYLVFITGPSRTADIELTVTLGVHGPKQLYVWMMADS